jgi:hypothetical protein
MTAKPTMMTAIVITMSSDPESDADVVRPEASLDAAPVAWLDPLLACPHAGRLAVPAAAGVRAGRG